MFSRLGLPHRNPGGPWACAGAPQHGLWGADMGMGRGACCCT